MTETLKLVAWLWNQPGGAVRYEPWNVRIWASMLKKHVSIPHTLAVVTDIEGDFGEGVEVIAPPGDLEDARIPSWGAKRPQCLRRLAMFRRDAADIFGADRIVCTDLDLIVCGSLDSVLDIKDDFRITRGTASTRAYNGSMMSLRLGSRPQAYERFSLQAATEAGRRHVGSDQAWLAHCLPGEPTWGPQDGVRFWGVHHPIADARVVFFAGQLKPWALAEVGKEAAVTMHYRGSRRDRCLILGYGPQLWDDVAATVGGDRFGAVIASPEAAPHWPGPILAIAADDAHAERLAVMHGFSDVAFCGRTLEGGEHGADR